MFEYSVSTLFEKNVVNSASIFLSPATQAREYLSKLGDLSQTQIFAKIENVEVFSRSLFFHYSLM
jgi:hypothetical protein